VSFEQLVLFRDIVQTKSVSRGAAMSGISQSAASQHLHELETRLGVALLDRSTRPFTLTPAGKLYHELCRDVLERHAEFQAALEGLKTDVEGTVRVASIYSVGLSEMSYVKHEFSARHPSARLEVEYLRPDKVYEAVREDRADLGFVSYPHSDRQLAVIPWRREQMVVAAPPSHPLARRKRIAPAELSGLAFVGFDQDLPIRQAIDRFLREHGVAVELAMHFDNIQMVKEAVALGGAVSILPERAMQAEVEQGRLVAIPLDAELRRPIGIIHRRRKKFNRAAQCFLDLLEREPAPEEPATAAPTA
jgi:LysR family transcriptional regulator, transcriptional activator of the cysJI operon